MQRGVKLALSCTQSLRQLQLHCRAQPRLPAALEQQRGSCSMTDWRRQSSDCYTGPTNIQMAAMMSVLDLTEFALRRFNWQLLRVCSVSRRPFCSSS